MSPTSTRPGTKPRRRLTRRQVVRRVLLWCCPVPIIVAIVYGAMMIQVGPTFRNGMAAYADEQWRDSWYTFRSLRGNPIEEWKGDFAAGTAALRYELYQGAVNDLDRALARVPDEHRCLVQTNRAIAYEALGDERTQEAQEELDAALALAEAEAARAAGEPYDATLFEPPYEGADEPTSADGLWSATFQMQDARDAYAFAIEASQDEACGSSSDGDGDDQDPQPSSSGGEGDESDDQSDDQQSDDQQSDDQQSDDQQSDDQQSDDQQSDDQQSDDQQSDDQQPDDQQSDDQQGEDEQQSPDEQPGDEQGSGDEQGDQQGPGDRPGDQQGPGDRPGGQQGGGQGQDPGGQGGEGQDDRSPSAGSLREKMAAADELAQLAEQLAHLAEGDGDEMTAPQPQTESGRQEALAERNRQAGGDGGSGDGTGSGEGGGAPGWGPGGQGSGGGIRSGW